MIPSKEASEYEAHLQPAPSLKKKSIDELEFDGGRDDARRAGLAEKQPDGFPPAFAVVEREVVDVHPDEAIRERGVEVARPAHRMPDARRAIFKAVTDALAQYVRNLLAHGGGDGLADDVAPERERQPRFFLPPFAEVENLGEPFARVRQLAFVDDQPDIRAA